MMVSSDGKNPLRVRCVSHRISSSPGWVERREDDGAPARHRDQPFEFGGIGRWRRNIEFQVARGDDVAAAKRGETLGIGGRLRQADVELFQDRRYRPRKPAPARKRTRRHAAVDQDHRQPPRRTRQDQIGPQIGFDEQRKTRSPVIEEAADEARQIIGHILMDDVGRKPPRHDRCRGHRARGEENADIESAQPFDQAGRRQHLADTGPVDPDHGAARPGIEAEPAALADSLRILLALLDTLLDQGWRQGRRRQRQAAIETQRHRQWISHAGTRRGARSWHRRGASPRSASLRDRVAAVPWWRRRHPAAR